MTAVGVAILGAAGFIGSRTVEILHLKGVAEVRPVVRTEASLVRLSRFDLECRVADACDQAALVNAFEGCDLVVHAVAGDRGLILGSLAPTYHAAQAAGVRRLVYLSTAAVHGQAPDPGTDESSPLTERQPVAYNVAKVRAERRLLQLRQQGSVEVVILRPGIVFGPRSSWVVGFADDLLEGKAYLLNGGTGICNSIYVDNLVHAICLAMTAPSVDRHAFLVGDNETITWFDFYHPIAAALGYDLADVVSVSVPGSRSNWPERFDTVRASRPVQAFLSLFPTELRQAAFDALCAFQASRRALSPWALPIRVAPAVSPELALLAQCRYKLPFRKASRMLGYEPVISFTEACRRTIGWLAFAGYPVVNASPSISTTTNDGTQNA